MAKVLLVTNYDGVLSVTPLGNKDWYLSRNNVVKNQQYKVKEMDEAAAYKFIADNNNIDPDFKSPKQVNQALEDKDKEIEALRKQLAELNDPETIKLRQQMAEFSTASTSTGEYQQAAADQIKDAPKVKPSK